MNIIIATLVIIVILAALTGFQYLICCALRSGSEHDDKLAHLYDDRERPPIINEKQIQLHIQTANDRQLIHEHGTASMKQQIEAPLTRIHRAMKPRA